MYIYNHQIKSEAATLYLSTAQDQGPNSRSQTGAPGLPDLYSTGKVKVCNSLPVYRL